jgi:fumarate reductase subunit D
MPESLLVLALTALAGLLAPALLSAPLELLVVPVAACGSLAAVASALFEAIVRIMHAMRASASAAAAAACWGVLAVAATANCAVRARMAKSNL